MSVFISNAQYVPALYRQEFFFLNKSYMIILCDVFRRVNRKIYHERFDS